VLPQWFQRYIGPAIHPAAQQSKRSFYEGANGAVGALDIGIPLGLTGLDIFEPHIAFPSPFHELRARYRQLSQQAWINAMPCRARHDAHQTAHTVAASVEPISWPEAL